jgi:hypothetical protein
MQETVLKTTHPSRILHMKWYFIASIFILIWTVFIFKPIPIFLPLEFELYVHALLALAIISIGIGEYNHIGETYVITDHRMIHKEGTFHVSESSVSWAKINQYRVIKSFLEGLIGIGSIEFSSSSGTTMTKKLSGIKGVERIIHEQITESQEIDYSKPKIASHTAQTHTTPTHIPKHYRQPSQQQPQQQPPSKSQNPQRRR